MTRLVAVEVERLGYEVTTSADIAAVVGINADKQALCDVNSTECMADIAAALGAEIIAHGNVAGLNKQVLVTVNFFDARHGKSLGRESLVVDNLDALPEALAKALRSVLKPLNAPPPPTPPAAGPSPLAVAAAAGGVVTVVGAGVAGAVALINGSADTSGDLKAGALAAYPWALGAAAAGVVVVGASAALWVIE